MTELGQTIGAKAIEGESPAGANIQYEPEFEQLQAEIDKLQSVTGEHPNWDDVARLGTELLTDKSKDLKVASYLALGLYKQKSFAGLADGFAILIDLLSTFWDNMYPELSRIKARKTAMEWMKDRICKEFEGLAPGPAEKDDIERCIDLFGKLLAIATEKFADYVPGIRVLEKELKEKLAMAAPSGGEEGDAASGAAPAAGGGGGGRMGTSGPIGSRADAFKRLQEIATFLRATEPHSPVSYLVNRAVKWGNMPLEVLLDELIKQKDARDRLRETLGLGE